MSWALAKVPIDPLAVKVTMRAIVVRHFRTLNNESRCIMGWGDAPPAANWEDDLEVVDRAFDAGGLHFDAYYSSALGRAQETARYYAQRRGEDEILSAPALNEVNYGEFFGLSKQSVEETCPQYKTDADYVFPGGESFHQMQERSVACLLDLETLHTGQTLLLVVHAGVIRGLISQFLGLELESNLKRKVSHRYIGDFSIEHGVCVRYNELGRPSGFVKDGVIEVPSVRS